MKKEFYRDEAGEHRWRLIGANGVKVGASSEGFSSKQKAQQNLELILGWGDEEDAPTVRALEQPQGLLAGELLLPREVATLLYDAKWTDVDKLVDMTATVFGESAGYTEAVGGPNADGTIDCGFLQLNSGHAAAWGMTLEQFKQMAFDPADAVVYARRLYVSAGYSLRPWYAYTNGSYKRHLPKSIVGVANAVAEMRGLDPVPHYKFA